MVEKVVVFGRNEPACPFCEKAKAGLKAKGIPFTYIDLSENPAIMALFKYQHSTVPQIYVDGDYHGDSSSVDTMGEPEFVDTDLDGDLSWDV